MQVKIFITLDICFIHLLYSTPKYFKIIYHFFQNYLLRINFKICQTFTLVHKINKSIAEIYTCWIIGLCPVDMCYSFNFNRFLVSSGISVTLKLWKYVVLLQFTCKATKWVPVNVYLSRSTCSILHDIW